VNPKLEAARSALIERAAGHARARLAGTQAEMVAEFLRRYWERVAPEDLVGRDPVDVYGAGRAHLHMAEKRVPGSPRVRVYTPSFEEHGWASPHSVVEVTTDDMPFLVDSISMELSHQGVGLHLVVHPVIPVNRDGDGRLTGVGPGVRGGSGDGEAAVAEAFLHVEIDRQPSSARMAELRGELLRVLGDLRAAVEDWLAMRTQALAIAEEFQERPPPVDPDVVSEARDLLRFLADDHFVFLGFRDYDLVTRDGETLLEALPGSGLGILREAERAPSQSFSRVPTYLRDRARMADHPITLTRSSSRSTVHRPGALDYVGVVRYDASGTATGERRFLGLYTSALHKVATAEIPVMRRTVQAVLDRAGFAPTSHNGKALAEVLEAYPRHELFELTADELYDTALGILALQERQRVRLFARRDRFGRYWSCLVYVPLDRYTQAVRGRITDILMSAFSGTAFEYHAQVGESVLARLHFVVHTDAASTGPGALPPPDLEMVEEQLAEAARAWADDLTEAALEHYGEERGVALLGRYAQSFPAAYRADFPARAAVADIERIESLGAGADLALSLTHPLEGADGLLRFKLFQADRPVPLSDVLPALENMGVRVIDQRPYEVRPRQGTTVWIHDFGLAPGAGVPPITERDLDADELRENFSDAFAAVWRGDAENDRFNRLVLGAALTWREVAVLRAYARYQRQAGSTFSQSYVANALVANPHVARLLVELFHARFDPDRHLDPEDEASVLTKRLEAGIDAVASLDQDRILRSFLALVQATLRTNWFCGKQHLALKLDPAAIPDLPLPRPRFEIFVCSPRVEGVHLRGGRVARGGIRWSDRREDFRTEILGLMKAQMVKNAVIVPVGAKGGFVVKQPGGRGVPGETADDVAECYRIFVSGLLDVTDNIVDGEVVTPARVVAHDGDDPYLVVAADKGTATFSDLANTIAAEHRFWLGDAFASGGSSGYDHKKMGITARGAWESVRRHFRELGVDVEATPTTAVGIGDMSGDVFGNGMLLSSQLRLVAAFDHRHVFLDPDPDAAAGFAERKRLFRLPRSTWADYNRDLISEGGGNFPRTAKSIPLSPQVRQTLAVDDEALMPHELIRAILRAPVDLLWNGGIGTYVKASAETHADAGDKANDAVRVDAAQLRARVVAEGGNLGFTQRGRVEYALAGGRINTDAIDNSAGVDCSDHEVNIKALLDTVVADGELTGKQRDRLLADMAADVAAMVLRDNYDQTAALANALAQAGAMVDVHARYLRRLEAEGKLDRVLEFLPSDEVLAQRRSNGGGLVAPEFAVLLAYTKIDVAAQLLASDVPEDPWLGRELTAYFPPQLSEERFADAMRRHPLRREIVAARVTNRLVDRAGTSFVYRLSEETGAGVPELARAQAAAREIFSLEEVWVAIEALDNQVEAATQRSMVLVARRLAERATRWLLRHRPAPLDVAGAISEFAPGAAAVADLLPGLLSAADRGALAAAAGSWEEAGVPVELARRVAALRFVSPALDVVEVGDRLGRPVEEVGAVYFGLGERLELDWLSARIEVLPRDDRWQTLARAALRDDWAALRAALTAEVLAHCGEPGAVGIPDAVENWIAEHRTAAERFLLVLDDIRGVANPDLATLSVAVREARALVS
jgi:glutamate dehydrogenase